MKTTQLLQRYSTNIRIAALALLFVATQSISSVAQEGNNTVRIRNTTETYGHTLNMGLGIGYFGYLGYTVPFFNINYEINTARNFTLAPSVGFASYRSYDYYYYAGSRYYYHATVMPIGVKGTYYFDKILGAGPNWDFYLAGTLGFNVRTVSWDNGYYGDRGVYREGSPLYLDLHIGTEYHISRNCGLYLDVSTGVSTFGLAVHHL